MPGLTQVPTSITLSGEQFEKLYLSPMMHRQSHVSKTMGNPTPLYVPPFPWIKVRWADHLILGRWVLTSSQPHR
jgi:hypothetical protein